MSVPEINELARRIARSDAEDAAEQKAIRQLLATLRSRVQGEKAHDVRLRLDSALLLADYLQQTGGVGGDEILRIVSRLVASMDQYFNPSVTLRKKRAEAPPTAAPGPFQDQFEPVTMKRELSNHDEILRAMEAESPQPTGRRELTPEDEKEHGLISDMLLGEILVQFGTINSTQVLQALELQQNGSLRFGDALIQLGAATRSDIERAIAYHEGLSSSPGQERPGPNAPLPNVRPAHSELKLVSDMMLGDLLVRMGRVTTEQLEAGLRAQRATGTRIGEALVQMGAATWADVEEGLRIQSERRVAVK